MKKIICYFLLFWKKNLLPPHLCKRKSKIIHLENIRSENDIKKKSEAAKFLYQIILISWKFPEEFKWLKIRWYDWLIGLKDCINDNNRKNCVLLNLVQELFDIEAWLLLTFFLCLHNQLISIHNQLISMHSIVTYYKCRCLKNVIHQIDRNGWLLLSTGFMANLSWCLFDIGKRFFL